MLSAIVLASASVREDKDEFSALNFFYIIIQLLFCHDCFSGGNFPKAFTFVLLILYGKYIFIFWDSNMFILNILGDT